MDIIDVMLARAMTPQGQTETYVSIAEAAAAKAEKAQQDAQAAIDVVTNAAEEITAAQEEAADLLAAAQDALETAQEAQINTLDTEDVDAEVKKLNVAVNLVNGNNANTYQVITTYPDNTLHTENATKMYKSEGQNEDGTMTQKAITSALSSKADSATVATKQYVDQKIAAIPSGSGSGNGANVNLDPDNAGHIVVVDDNGHVSAGTATEEEIIEALIRSGTYTAKDAVGLDIDYVNKSFSRVQEAAAYSMGQDFNKYAMYGGRTRCNVADNGVITAFYGDSDYKEDGSNGQVMIYQPKFYYKRIIHSTDNMNRGKAIRHETLLLSATEQIGFKLAPIFNGGLEYVLLPAYDAGLQENQLTSIANMKPVNNLTIAEAEAYANARGEGWHIMNLAAESANQMLEMVEFGTLNGQTAIESGIVKTPSGASGNCYFITGSTAALGNGTGHAESTNIDINGGIVQGTEDGMRAITYRGMENPWGNFWSMIGGLNIVGNGQVNGGMPYVCTNFNYVTEGTTNDYEDIGFNLPSVYGWVNAMGYGSEKYDWAYLPIECSSNANSLLPVGDGLWTVANLNGTVVVATGGSYGFKEECGPFYYAADRPANDTARYNYGAKIMFIPTKNNIYNANINKWNQYMGG